MKDYHLNKCPICNSDADLINIDDGSGWNDSPYSAVCTNKDCILKEPIIISGNREKVIDKWNANTRRNS